MNPDPASLVYLVLLLSAVAFWFFVQNRESLGKLTQQALAWALIFAGAIAVVALKDDIMGAVLPKQAVFASEGRIVLRSGHDDDHGHARRERLPQPERGHDGPAGLGDQRRHRRGGRRQQRRRPRRRRQRPPPAGPVRGRVDQARTERRHRHQ